MPIPRRTRPVRLVALLVVTALIAIVGPATAPANAQVDPPTRDLMLVGNNNAGTVSLIDAHTFAPIGEVNVIGDLAQRLAEMTPVERAAYEIVRGQAGGDKFVDDMAVSPDGRVLYVSRSNLADVAAFDLKSRQQLWRVHVSGHRADHMALSPDGTRLLVSALTAKRVDAIDTARGVIVSGFTTGDYPHENQFSRDGRLVYNASIGVVPVPDALEALKGSRQLTIADADTLQVKRVLTFDHGLRPFVITPDQQLMYAQLSFLNGFVEYSLTDGRILRTINMPLSDEAKKMAREDYPFDSAHHGIAMSGDGTKLCEAGTISDYVAIISRPALTVDRYLSTGDQPYWASTSRDGQYCYVSNSLSDTVSVISYDDAREVARIPVGHYPQRIRIATVPADVLTP